MRKLCQIGSPPQSPEFSGSHRARSAIGPQTTAAAITG
jgi:hypothetical protein